MELSRANRLDPPVDAARDHVLGSPDAPITLVEYGSYACPYCHGAHEVVANLRARFGERMRYVFRHLPLATLKDAETAAELAEYAAETTGEFWPMHDALMQRGPYFSDGEFGRIAAEFHVPGVDEATEPAFRRARQRVRDDAASARRSGAMTTPTFFINGRRYEGAWDETALAEAMLGSLGHRVHAAALDFARWAPSAGFLLLLMSLLSIALANSPFGPAFERAWQLPLGLRLGDARFELSLLDWVNHGLLTIFFVVVGLEIKRELTVGRLATRRAAALPVAASLGGMLLPAILFLLVVPGGPLVHGWAVPIATDTAFAIALIALLGERVPVELRVFLTAAVIVDDLVAIVVLALFYSGTLGVDYLVAAAALTVVLMLMNHAGIYRALPYALVGVLLWVCLHHAGVHATLAGVILAMVTPTRPPGNLRALLAQAEMVIRAETEHAGRDWMRRGPSEPTLQALDTIHDRIESPASKLLRAIEPWSSYAVLPLFALANAGVVLAPDVLEGNGRLVLAIVVGLALGKPLGIAAAAWLAVRSGIAEKPPAYSWRQLLGAGALAGIGFTMSLFISSQAFPPHAFDAAKIAIFIASLLAAAAGVAILTNRIPVPGSR